VALKITWVVGEARFVFVAVASHGGEHAAVFLHRDAHAFGDAPLALPACSVARGAESSIYLI
jgi:hypothetical protein